MRRPYPSASQWAIEHGRPSGPSCARVTACPCRLSRPRGPRWRVFDCRDDPTRRERKPGRKPHLSAPRRWSGTGWEWGHFTGFSPPASGSSHGFRPRAAHAARTRPTRPEKATIAPQFTAHADRGLRRRPLEGDSPGTSRSSHRQWTITMGTVPRRCRQLVNAGGGAQWRWLRS